ncbi:hypothetical protein BGZ60DRAFT_169364 [Tricladium varicosporioides]|nr:hypothetical protein BGZ60DRAFT_169364 [Hymenoscyphus varicosporioides]
MPCSQSVSLPSLDQSMVDRVSSLHIKDDTATVEQRTQGVSQPIKISPPTQFDQTKPFVYNGQLVYPVPPPGAIPVAMLGNPNFGHPIPATNTPGGFPPLPHFPMPLANLANSLVFPPGQQLPMMFPHALPIPEGGPAMMPFGPTLLSGVVPVSEITKTQIQGLRNHIQLIDSQIANNTNPSLEEFLSGNRSTILTQIGQMELMLQGQLAQENMANSTVLGGENKVMIRNTSLMITKNEKKAHATLSGQGYAPLSKHSSARSSTDTTERSGNTSNDFKYKINDARSTIRGDSTSKSRLTAAAAMAPPFQPRVQVTAVQPHESQMPMASMRVASPDEELPFETQAQIETRLLSKASTNWSTHSTFQRGSAPGGAPASLPRAHSMQEPPYVAHTRRMLPRSSTFHGQTELPPSTLAPMYSAQAVPYLVGVLPQNIRNDEAKPSDIIYPRPLTDEEIRARHLYWGNAPRSIQKGLPKFDGKDFYPPSPMKEIAQTVRTGTDVIIHDKHDSQTVPVLDFENLFTEPGVPGYKSPVRLSASQPNLHGAPVKLSTNGTDLGILEASSHVSWSTRNPRGEDQNYRPVTPPRSSFGADAPTSDDFSHLFLEHRAPGYKSPSPPRPASKHETNEFQQARNRQPVTPRNVEIFDEANGDDDETRTVDSWGLPTTESRWNGEEGCTITVGHDVRNDEQSNSSTAEIHLTPPIKEMALKGDLEGSFQERVASFSKYVYSPFMSPSLKLINVVLHNKPCFCRICSRVLLNPPSL